MPEQPTVQTPEHVCEVLFDMDAGLPVSRGDGDLHVAAGTLTRRRRAPCDRSHECARDAHGSNGSPNLVNEEREPPPPPLPVRHSLDRELVRDLSEQLIENLQAYSLGSDSDDTVKKVLRDLRRKRFFSPMGEISRVYLDRIDRDSPKIQLQLIQALIDQS